MRSLLLIVVLALLGVGAWLTQDQWRPALDAAINSPAQASSAASNTAAPGASSIRSTPADTTSVAPDSPAASKPGSQESAQVTQAKAEQFVATLTEPDPAPVTVEKADHFVTGEQMLSLVPRDAVKSTSVKELAADPTLQPDSPITVVREVEQVERVTPEKLIAQSAGNLDAPVQVLRNNEVHNSTVREVLEVASKKPDAPIDIITHSEYFEQTTPRELAQSDGKDSTATIKVIRKHHGLEASSISDLMSTQTVKSDSLFYVRTVREGDLQGIWGIVHDGIVQNFARGMAIRRGKEINTYKVDIPVDADERRSDASSSYLGRLIFNKSKESHVYNYNLNRMGRNPDRIYPGQEIVIIDFQADELIEIYKHFVAQQG